jgi:hypothetical protein
MRFTCPRSLMALSLAEVVIGIWISVLSLISLGYLPEVRKPTGAYPTSACNSYLMNRIVCTLATWIHDDLQYFSVWQTIRENSFISAKGTKGLCYSHLFSHNTVTNITTTYANCLFQRRQTTTIEVSTTNLYNS